MKYFFYCRDRAGVRDLRWKLVEDHWAFMDQYADAMIARGPTLADDLETATGSVHIVDLPNSEAARVFAFEEPNYRAGVYGDVFVRRYADLLGRTMWEFPRRVDAEHYLILAHAKPGAARPEHGLDRERLVAFGQLLAEDGTEWVGTAVIGEFPDAAAVRALLEETGAYERVELHHWTFGGRR